MAGLGCWLSLRVCAGPSDAAELGPPSLLLLCAGWTFVATLLGFPSVPLPAACPAAGSLWKLRYLSGGAMSVGFEVSFVRRLFFALCRALIPAPAVCTASPAADYP